MPRPSLVFSSLLAGVSVSLACTPPGTALSNTITQPFGILIQNPAVPIIHNRYFGLNQAGGGDYHPYLTPGGEEAFDFQLINGVVTRPSDNIRVVISIQVGWPF
jgi:kremen protein